MISWLFKDIIGHLNIIMLMKFFLRVENLSVYRLITSNNICIEKLSMQRSR